MLGGIPTSASGLTIPSIPSSVPVSIPGGYSDPTGLIAQQLQQQGLVPTDPNVSGYIASIQQAAIAEGLPANGQDVVSRVQTFATAYQQMYNNPSVASVGNAVQVSLNAARQYVTQNHELAGAISTAQGLVTAFEQAASGGGTPQDVAAAFTGPLIAAAVAAGAVSAGVGAVIVAGVSIAASILDSVHLFADKPGIQVCPSFKYTGSGTPSFSINCMAVFDQTGGAISPGSANWRSFPQASDPSVAWWFQGMASGGTYNEWKQAMWIPRPNGGGFPIIEAFSNWMWIAGPTDVGQWSHPTAPRAPGGLYQGTQAAGCFGALSDEQLNTVLSFDGAFVKAWESNSEFWLNGRHGADDGSVLIHTAEIWNRSHAPGQGVDIAGTSSTGAFYWATLIGQAVNAGNADILSSDRSKLHLNTGPLVDFPGISKNGSLVGPSATSKVVASAAAASVGTAAIGVGAYSLLTGMTYGKALDVLWAQLEKGWRWLRL